MFQGMNRNETQALIALVVLIAVGIGVQTYQKQRHDGGLWLEHTAQADAHVQAVSNTVNSNTEVDDESSYGHSPQESSDPGPVVLAPININTANTADLQGLTMIGPVRAQSIVDYRQRNGAFQSVEDLINVSGIGPKTMDRLRSSITIGQGVAEQTAQGDSIKVPPTGVEVVQQVAESVDKTVAEAGRDSLININTATATQLEELSGIGPVKAGNIIQWRDFHGGFQSVDDLIQVSGIGPKTLERMRPDVSVGKMSSLQSSPRMANPQTQTLRSATTAQSPVAPARTQKININTATAEELQELSGIGPVKARSIVQWRSRHGYFRNVRDFTKVSAIGPKTLEKNIHRITTGTSGKR